MLVLVLSCCCCFRASCVGVVMLLLLSCLSCFFRAVCILLLSYSVGVVLPCFAGAIVLVLAGAIVLVERMPIRHVSRAGATCRGPSSLSRPRVAQPWQRLSRVWLVFMGATRQRQMVTRRAPNALLQRLQTPGITSRTLTHIIQSKSPSPATLTLSHCHTVTCHSHVATSLVATNLEH